MTRRSGWLSRLMLWAALAAVPAQGAPLEMPADAPPLRYRRVLVPQESLAEQTRGYLPMEREKFRQMLADIAAQNRSSGQRATWIESAEYHAVVSDGQLVSGNAVLQVTHTAAEPAAISLAPWALAAGAGTWQAGDAISAAIMGTDAAGNLLALVPASGELHVPWTLSGTTNEWGESRFELWLAAAPMSRMVLDVPRGHRVWSDRGVVVAPDERAADPAAPADAALGLQRWIVELGGQTRCTLTVAPRERDPGRQRLVSVQEGTAYRLTDEALEIACDIGLEIQREPLAELRLDIDAEVQVTAVRLGNVDLPWSSAPGADGRSQTVAVQFGERLAGAHSTLQITAVSPLHTDTLWRLPALRPQGVFWRQGTMSLLVPDTLILRHLRAVDAQQSLAAPGPDGGMAQQLVFELFGADGALELNVTRRRREIQAQVGTTIDLGSGSISAQMLVDLKSRFGERFVIEAYVPNPWTIDGIDAEPAAALHDYQVVAYEPERRRLQIQLVRPLMADRPLRLKIRAHRTPRFPLTAEILRPVEFLDTTYETRLVSVAPEANYRLAFEGDNALECPDPASLAPADAVRVPARPGAVIFVDDEHAQPLRINVTREDPAFAASVYVDAEFAASKCLESYRIVCTPEATPVAQLRVQLSEARPADVIWQFVGETNVVLPAKRIADPRIAGGPVRPGETWEIDLGRPQAASFEIRGQRTTPGPEKLTVSLATLPAAVAHDGRLTIRSLDGTRLAITASGVKPVPCDPAPPGSYPTSRACYGFDASRNARVEINRATSRADGATLWAWNARLTSQYLATGEAIHVATFLLESAGGSEFRVRLPEGCTLRGVEINGADAGRALSTGADGSHTIALPNGQRFPRVEVAYGESQSALGVRHRLATEFPNVDIPLLQRSWRVWLPPDYRPVEFHGGCRGAANGTASWKRRLLGPLAGDAPSHLLHSLAPAEVPDVVDQSEAEGNRPGADEAILESLGAALLTLAAETGGQPLTWRAWFERYAARKPGVAPSGGVWVDASWLADEGFSLDRALPAWTGDDPVEVARRLLMAERLVIAVQDDVALVTNHDGWVRFARADAQPIHLSSVLLLAADVQPHFLAGADTGAWPGVVPLATWIGAPAHPEPPWAAPGSPSRAGVAGHPWRLCEVPVDEAGQCRLTVVRASSLGVLGWSLLLLVAGIAGAWAGRVRRYLWPLLVAACVFALVVPAGWVPITSHLCPGILLGVAVSEFRRWAQAQAALPEVALGEGTLAPAKVLALVLAALASVPFAARPSWAVEPLSQTSAPGLAADTIHTVVVPVNAELMPVGEYDYLPLDFYDALHLRAGRQIVARDAWFVGQATYRAVFDWRQQRSSLDLTSLTAVYQLEVVRTRGQLEFPWDGEAGGVELLEARLDSKPVEFTWNTARSGFWVQLPGPGSFQFELVLRPELREQPGERSLQFAVPPVAQARLEVEAPFGAPDVRVPGAVGSSYVDPESGVRHTELGPLKELTLGWPATADQPAPQQTDVQQLIWLRLHPADQREVVIVESQFQMRSAVRPIEEVKLRVDPRLRLISEPAAPSFEWLEAPDPQTGDVVLTLRVPGPATNELKVRLRFLLTNTTGLGNVSLPRLEPLEGPASDRWLAVSVSPDVEFAAGTSEMFKPMDAAEFLAMWGAAESAPNLCYRILAEDPGWSIATRSRQPRSQANQSVAISIGRAGLDCTLEADIDTSNGEVFQHQVTVPRELRVNSVSVRSGETEVAQAVDYDGSGTLTVFLQRGVSGPHRMILHGLQPLDDETTAMPLPSLTLAEVALRKHAVRIYRQPAMWAEIQTEPDLPLIAVTPETTFHETLGRLLTAFELTEERPSQLPGVSIRVRPNEPQVDARLVTTLRRTKGQWEAVADFDAQVSGESGGCMEQFRFEIPAEWTGPFTLEPDLPPYEIHTAAGQRHLLTVRLWSPVSDRVQLRIRGPLQLGPNERGRTPNIEPLDAASVERFVVLPAALDGQRVDWETPGLIESPLPDFLRPAAVDDQVLTYRVWSQPRAVIADVQPATGNRQIAWADVFVDCQASGHCSGVATFAVEPAGVGHCTLEIPAGLELIQATVDSVPAALVQLADRRWQLRLASEQLPQQVAIRFCGQLPTLKANCEQLIAVPWITDPPVARTLWTVRGPAGGVLSVTHERARAVSAARQEVVRLQHIAGLLTSGAETVLDRPERDVQAWYAPWAVQLACAGARFTRWHWLDEPAEGDVESAAVAEVYRQQEAIARRIKAAPTVGQYAQQTSRLAQLVDVWRLSSDAAGVTSHYQLDGAAAAVPVYWRVEGAGAFWPRLLAIAVVAALGFGCYALASWGVFVQWCRRWPWVLGILVGIVWWLLAWPSYLGGILIVASLWKLRRIGGRK